MIIYSVTVMIENATEKEWFSWMQSVHIPDVMATGFFTESHMHKLVDPIHDPSQSTFNIQYTCESMEVLEQYQQTSAPALQKDHTEKFKNRFVAFRTILKRF